MANSDQEEEKYSNIRQTVRKFVLPLVQSIYDEEPSDVIQFCSRYYYDLLQKREGNRARQVTRTNEKEGKDCKISEKFETVEVPPATLQGSASDPVITNEKRSGGSSLRETSSWDVPSSLLSRAQTVLDCNFLDAECGIGDRPDLAVNQIGQEIGGKAGDVNTVKDEGFEEYSNEIKNSIKVDFVPKPSAPPYEDAQRNFKDDEKKEILICRKELSPNSSFGFIPHLKECGDSDDQEVDNCSGRRTNQEIEELAKKMSETFQVLAQKFNSAENNFRAEFENAKEISDVVRGKPNEWDTISGNDFKKGSVADKDDMKNYDDFVREKNRKNYECSGHSDGEIDESDSDFIEPDLDFLKDENNNVAGEIYIDDCEVNKTVNGDKIGDAPNNSKKEIGKESNLSSDVCISDSKETRFQVEKEMEKDECESAIIRDGNKNDCNKSDCFESNIDESWRRRWYAAHPCLDNVNTGNFERTGTRSRWNQQPGNWHMNNYRRGNIGEAGDAPCSFYPHGGDYPWESNNNISSSSTVRKCSDTHDPTSDKVDPRTSGRRTFGNLPGKDMANTNPPSAHYNIPNTWRNNKNATGNRAELFRKSQLTLKRDTFDSGNENPRSGLVRKDEDQNLESPDYGQNMPNSQINKEQTSRIKQGTDCPGKDNLISDPYSHMTNEQESRHKQQGFWDSSFENPPVEFHYEQNGFIPEHVSAARGESSANLVHDAATENGASSGASFLDSGESAIKLEPGLNSACGDFVLTVNDPNLNVRTFRETGRDGEESDAGRVELNSENARVGGSPNTYFEDVVGRVTEEQKRTTDDSYEGLSFIYDSGSDVSSETSEFSEYDAEDYNCGSTYEGKTTE